MAASQPASAPTTRAATQPLNPAAPVSVQVTSAEEEQTGWLRIETLDEKVSGAWASGHRRAPNRMVIETENVHQFSIDTSQLELNWNERVWVRIDRHAFELVHKRHPVVHFRETPAGAWEIVEVHDP